MYWIACAVSLLVWKRERRRWYALAGLAAGVAAGIKLDRGIVLLVLLLGHAFRRKECRRVSNILLAGAAFVLGFVCANPVMLFVPFEYVDGITRELSYHAMRNTPGETSFIALVTHLNASVGVGLLGVSVVMGTFAVWRLGRAQGKPVAWLLMTIVPYATLTANTTFVEWYAPLLFPALFLLTAAGTATVMKDSSKPVRAAVAVGVVAAATVTAARTGSLLAQYRDETRARAERWLASNLPQGAVVGIPYYSPAVPRSVRTVPLPQEFSSRKEQLAPRARLQQNATYQSFRARLLDIGLHMGGRGIPYSAWFDRMAANVERDAGPEGNAWRTADYLIIIPEQNPELLAYLRAARPSYVEAARFEPPRATLVTPRLEFVNPPVVVFRRIDGVPRD
jgi:4-amino-4-deoxy-L-arabinose transferase-like glycosyltransferase